MTFPSITGLLMRKAASDEAQMRKSEASARCEPKVHCVSIIYYGASGVRCRPGQTLSKQTLTSSIASAAGATHRRPNPNTIFLGSYSGSAPSDGKKRLGLKDSGSV